MKQWSTFLVPALLFGSVYAQQRPVMTTQDYARAERFLTATQQYVDHVPGRPTWLSGDRFWYRNLIAEGSEFILVNAAKGTRTPAFDQQKLAESLSGVTNTKYTAWMLPFQEFTYAPDEKFITFSAHGKSWKCDLKSYQITADTTPKNRADRRNETLSPDGKKAAFIKDYNLWLRDLSTGQLTQLTKDGVKDFGYATDNAGWKHSDRAIVTWSPDSRKIATFQQDERAVGDMYLATTNVGHPTLEAWKYPLPGDSAIAMIHRVIIEVENPKVIRLQVSPDPHRSTLGDDISRGGELNDVQWSEDGSQLAFVSTSRDHKQEKVRIADAVTGAVREVFGETSATQFESGQTAISWKYLPKTKELIWYSERDNWGHLYLYDATTGQLKNQITKGDWVVLSLTDVDEKNRTIYFMAGGKETGNPYFAHFYKVGFDGKNLVSLTPEPGNHQISLSPSGNYFSDLYAQPDVPSVLTVRNTSGKLVAQLEKTDVTRLKAAGWKAPIPFSAKAHDGKTDVYGLLYTPTHLDPNKKYPVIDYIYPGPQGGSVGNWGFAASRRDNQALAELGFIVVELEGTSNPKRSKSFHDMSYGNMAENTLPDQISAIKQLASTYAYMDTSKVGIWGHSGGGFATACAMFRYPDFFKVGISESGNHDNRNYEDDWGERYIGLETKGKDGKSNYENQANQVHARNLKGKLMLAHGMLDDNVPPYNTLLVVEALEKANKDYDLVIFPNSRHGFGAYSNYMMRRRWDYFVRHLLGAEPPKEYLIKSVADPRNEVK
ncbi:DPP IV N-terminal domain-containing protein [Siphonobacter sp. SORGH_AS_0500]|uniref:S9 family peptidase n=1 Tax=Siphonobacter sp. SORGH_AS_0500 TaxID=1864824 RepID=UPI00285A055C|nr:DPP IV N-terminal domain-containing protein [Siphonobacter sp. SORGH_AS_0500]MDR6194565.1 dipeptidyl aminopeptidase/acylaminoacyl peptidase [Siphonobacter sp. SORGH_AS_0500]